MPEVRQDRSLGKEIDEAFAAFNASCWAQLSPLIFSRIRGWLGKMERKERMEALQLVWFKLDEVDRRLNHLDLTVLRSIGLEKMLEARERLQDPGLACSGRADPDGDLKEIKSQVDRLDYAIALAEKTLALGSQAVEKRWPYFLKRYGDPLRHPKVPSLRPISFEFGSTANSQYDIFERAKQIVSAPEARHLHPPLRLVAKRNLVERWLATRYYKKRLGSVAADFVAFETECSFHLNSADYARRVFEWLRAHR